jgi:hypothetical protein
MDEITKSDVGHNEVAASGFENIDGSKTKMGRPLKFKTVEELQTKIDDFFKYCDDGVTKEIVTKSGEVTEIRERLPYTLSGLADYLDIDRRTLLNYSYKDDFFPAIMRARRKCERYSEEQLYIGNDRGAKFGLINNYGWADKQETILTGPDGGPIQAQTVPFSYQDFANLSPDDRQKIEDAARIVESLKNR